MIYDELLLQLSWISTSGSFGVKLTQKNKNIAMGKSLTRAKMIKEINKKMAWQT